MCESNVKKKQFGFMTRHINVKLLSKTAVGLEYGSHQGANVSSPWVRITISLS